MDNNLIELAKLIFDDIPKEPYSVQMELENFNSQEELFEVLLHLFIYGYKIKKLNVNTIEDLKPYFKCIGVNFNLEIISYSELEFFTNEKYLNRYCNISNTSFDNYDLDKLGFILSRNFKGSPNIDNMLACYIHEIPNNFVESFISFISFNYKLTF